jgi:TldD protein
MECFATQFQDQVRSLVQKYRTQADYFTIRLEQSEGTDIGLRRGQIETLSNGISLGGQVRVCHKGGWGMKSFNRIEQLETYLQQAIAAAKWVGNEQTELAPIPILEVEIKPLSCDPREIAIAQKKDLCVHYDQILQQVSEQIVTTNVRYSDSIQKMMLASSEGTWIEQQWADWEMRFCATAKDNETLQVGRETTGSRAGFSDLVGLDPVVRSAAERAAQALSLPVVKGDSYTVVIDPILAGLFVHEAFGHLSEADTLYQNPDLLEVMSLGRRFGSPELQIFDGALVPGHRGSYGYDDEGVAASTTQLIKDGVLVGRLHSRETARKLGEQVTGNARCLNYHYAPIVRMTNTWIGLGKTSVSDLFVDIPIGVYAKNWQGGMTNGEMFTFTAGEAWMIRNGKIAEPVRDVTLSGNVFETLADIEAIADDFGWDESGGCGKGGQSGLPVGCGSPSLRIANVVIGGED